MALVNEREIEWTESDRENGTLRRKQLSEAAGSEQLGCSLYELPPEATAWPYHYHTANEEAIFVLAGNGQLRTAVDSEGDGTDTDSATESSAADHATRTFPLEAGDYVALPADATGGHQVVNSSENTLRYLVVSTMCEPDVTVYPDSDTLGVFVGSPPGGRDPRSLHGYYRIDEDVAYEDA